jgi:hypothetical protein
MALKSEDTNDSERWSRKERWRGDVAPLPVFDGNWTTCANAAGVSTPLIWLSEMLLAECGHVLQYEQVISE